MSTSRSAGPRHLSVQRARCRWVAGLLAVSAWFCAPASGDGFESLDIATRLIEENPTELVQLEAMFGVFQREWMDGVHSPMARAFGDGPLERVELWRRDFDLHHDDPADPNPSLGEWSVVFRDACPQIHGLLEETLGPPARSFYELPYGVLAYRSASVERCTLAWYLSEPKQVPFPSVLETAALQTALIRLLSKRVTRSRIEQLFGPLEFDAGWNEDRIERPTWSLTYRPTGAEDPDRVALSFARSLPATDGLLAALGFKRPVVMSTDVHMHTRKLVNLPRFTDPRIRGRRIRVGLADVGLEPIEIESEWLPPSPVWQAEEPQIVRIDLIKDRRRR
ncbi:MAG: hypothetical protein MPN21_26260 [Thermoanaerobaculia bacterium]|nr:hypothetical protein [Thermoanaerobaculia bacterium]